MPRLIVIKGADEGRQFDLTEETVGIGRDRTNRVHLHDTEVSRRHLELRRQSDGVYQLADLGSANGTVVNARSVQSAALQPGDHIQIGQTILVYSGSRAQTGDPPTELANKVRMIHGGELGGASAIIRRIGEDVGSQILKDPQGAGTDWLKGKLASLAVMYEASQAVSHILDVDQLLERIMDLIFRSIEADHACIMLRNSETGELEPKFVRSRSKDFQGKVIVSRTIIDHVLQMKEGILVSDAAGDERFKTGESITQLQIREVLCVPMKGRHETMGVIFLDTLSDTRTLADSDEQSVKFTQDHLRLAIALAHQAALAVEGTRYHEALVHAERLAAVGQTIAALSHHIKNIMQGIVFGSDLLNKGLGEDDQELIVKGWRMVEKNQAKIHAMVLDMLSYSKEREPSLEPTELNEIVEDVLELVRGRAEEMGATVEFLPSKNVPMISADPEGVHRALLNIIGNALDAVEDRPKPYVAVQSLLESNNKWVRVIVLDHGIGIEPSKREEIFKPFVSTKGGRGTGLGLAVSRKIFREHGGDITVESQPGRGSKFVLRLPIKPDIGSDSGGTLIEIPTLPTLD